MLVTLACVGRLKQGPERALVERYCDRAIAAGRAVGLVVRLRELPDSHAARAPDRRREESAAIAALCAADTMLVLLDEAGRNLTSAALAELVGGARDNGRAHVLIAIGGADGLDPALRDEAAATVAFGACTWPHQLVRILACEQIYRTVTILAGHPYHRA